MALQNMQSTRDFWTAVRLTQERVSDGKGFEKPGAHPKECHKEAVAEEASP